MNYRRPVQFRSCLAIAMYFSSLLVAPPIQGAGADDAQVRVADVVSAAGGEDKLLKLFRFRERVLITSTPAAPVSANEPGNRESIVEVGGRWWIGESKADRGKDKVRLLCWAWSLRILLDPKAKVTILDDSLVDEKMAFGLRVTEVSAEPIDLLFDKTHKQLLAIDHLDSRHLVSDWKKTPTGHPYPTHVAGFKFVDRATKALEAQQWYQTDILELVPLQELPPGLAPKSN